MPGTHDRLEAGVVADGRSQIVQLTKKGSVLFDKVFPAHLAYVHKVFADFTSQDYTRIDNDIHDRPSARAARISSSDIGGNC